MSLSEDELNEAEEALKDSEERMKKVERHALTKKLQKAKEDLGIIKPEDNTDKKLKELQKIVGMTDEEIKKEAEKMEKFMDPSFKKFNELVKKQARSPEDLEGIEKMLYEYHEKRPGIHIAGVAPEVLEEYHDWKWTEGLEGVDKILRRPNAFVLWYSEKRGGVAFLHQFILSGSTTAYEDEPQMFLGLGGMKTVEGLEGKGHMTHLLISYLLLVKKNNPEFRGILLNGQPGRTLWKKLGFIDIGPSLTRPETQRLWYFPLRDDITELPELELYPQDFHF